jgi:hypothetical protein
MKKVHPYLERVYVVGVTDPLGGGKNTLVNRLTRVACNKGLTVGIVAVDNSSPFMGGAVRGDLIRMQQHRKELLQRVEQRLQSQLYQLLPRDDKVASLIKKVERGEMDAYAVAVSVEKTLAKGTISWINLKGGGNGKHTDF